MRLVAGQARLVRQWSFCCIGGTNVCLCVICVAGGMAWLRYASGTPMCVYVVCGLHLDCKYLLVSVGEALALAVVLVWDGACEGEGRAR